MLDRGVYMAPSQFEANFISYAHEEMCLKKTVKAFGEALKAIE
jgi:glutamate-1-semialdehyde 2,1-aminomutase